MGNSARGLGTQEGTQSAALSLRPACVLTYSRVCASSRPDSESRGSTSRRDADSGSSSSGGWGKEARWPRMLSAVYGLPRVPLANI